MFLKIESSSSSPSAIYANRQSLMSTGSSENITENSSESSVTSNPGMQPMSPNPNSEEILRSWTNYSQMGWSPVAPSVASGTLFNRLASVAVDSILILTLV